MKIFNSSRLLAFIIFLLFQLGMGTSVKESAMPYGVIYFSDGASIEKFDLVTRKRQEIIPWLDHEGRYESNSIFPSYLAEENKMLFFRSYVWPRKHELVSFNFETQKEEDVQELNHPINAFSVSPDGQWLAYLFGNLSPDLTAQQLKPSPLQLVIRNLKNKDVRVVVDNVDPALGLPLWISNEELLYLHISGHIMSIDIISNIKKDIDFKGFQPCAVSADRTKILMIERKSNLETSIYVLDMVRGKVDFIKKIYYFSLEGAFIWSPDGKSFIYTRQSWSNSLPFNETGNLYWYDLETKKEVKLANRISLYGGFWLA